MGTISIAISTSPSRRKKWRAAKWTIITRCRNSPAKRPPGASVFYKDSAGGVFHTYSTFGRGVEALVGTYMILDMVPKGRDEDQLEFSMEWVRYHDRYGTNEFADADKPYWPETGASSNASCGCESMKSLS